jgi:hypothetical protein
MQNIYLNTCKSLNSRGFPTNWRIYGVSSRMSLDVLYLIDDRKLKTKYMYLIYTERLFLCVSR